jgi:hypothetical protein
MHFHTVEEYDEPPEHVRAVAEKRGNVPRQVPKYGLTATPTAPSGAGFSRDEQSGSSRIRFRIVPVTPPSITPDDRPDEEPASEPATQ